jgi:uncharacterized protein YjcR
MALNNKQLKAIELLVHSPHMTQNMIAETVGVHRDTIRVWKQKPEFKEELDKAIKSRWKGAEALAVNGMIDLASEGNFQALKYMLDNMGYKPVDKIQAEISNDIIINIGD